MSKPKSKKLKRSDFSNASLIITLAQFKAELDGAIKDGDSENAEKLHRGIINVEHEMRVRGFQL